MDAMEAAEAAAAEAAALMSDETSKAEVPVGLGKGSRPRRSRKMMWTIAADLKVGYHNSIQFMISGMAELAAEI
jgi:hypothetical protein